uniref:Pentatricopeptide repeat-containing protein n=1 Tax=Cannabis sativa TaxID=3483 RepID=A0A803NJI5_CANSA
MGKHYQWLHSSTQRRAQVVLMRVLIPLHKTKGMQGYHRQLAYCVSQFVQKEPVLGGVVVRGILKYWPLTNCQNSSSSMITLIVILRRGTTLSTTPYGVVSRFITVYYLRSLAISIAMPKFYSASSSSNRNSLSLNPFPELISLNKRISQLIRTGRIGEAREHARAECCLLECIDHWVLRNGDVVNAVDFFDKMPGVMLASVNALVSVLFRMETFDQMTERDTFSWNTMITGYVHVLDMEEASNLFGKMPYPDSLTWNSMISGFAEIGSLKLAMDYFEDAPKELGSSIGYKDCYGRCTSEQLLITMYSRCGAIKEARIIFNEMKQQKDVISWNAMIGGYAAHGVAVDALELFQLMKELNVQPTHITFIAVLNACAHAGLVKEGRKHFESMISEFGIRPQVEHYASLVDIISRQGQLEEALDLINNMPFKPDKAVWGAFLGGCKVHNNVHLAQLAAEALMRLEPESSAPYVLLHNMYADLGQWDNAGKIRLQTLPRAHVTVQKKPIMLLEKQVLMLSFNQVHLSMAKDKLYDCPLMGRKFRAMFQSTEDNVNAQRKKSAFLIHLPAKTVSKPLHR